MVDKAASTVTLIEHGSVTGYSYAVDIALFDPHRSAERDNTAYLYLTVLDKNFRGKGKVGLLTNELFRNLFKKGILTLKEIVKQYQKMEMKVMLIKFKGIIVIYQELMNMFPKIVLDLKT